MELNETMNIYTCPGQQVVFAFPNNGYPYQQEEAKKLLTVGQKYTVRCTDVSQSSTAVYLEGFDRPFNSVLFANC